MLGWLSVRPISASRRNRSRNCASSSRRSSGRLRAEISPAPLHLEDRGHPAPAEHAQQAEVSEPLLPLLVVPRAGVHLLGRGGDARRPAHPRRRLAGVSVRSSGRRKRHPREHADEPDRDHGERDEAGARAGGDGRQGRQGRVERGGAAARHLDVADGVLVAGTGHAHAVASGREAGLHEATRLRVGDAQRLVVEVGRRARRLRHDLERPRRGLRRRRGRSRPGAGASARGRGSWSMTCPGWAGSRGGRRRGATRPRRSGPEPATPRAG